MSSAILSFLLLTALIEVCPNPYGSDDAEYVKFYCSSPCVLTDGEGVIYASEGYHIATKNITAFKQRFGIDADIEFPKGFALSNRGEEICVDDDCFYYGRDVKILDDGVIYYRTSDGWDFRYEDWTNFSCVTDYVKGKLIITPASYKLSQGYVVASYTFAADFLPAELYVDASPPSIPCRELKLENVHFLAANSYRNFHYKFAIKGEHVVITTENWIFTKKGYIVEFRSEKVAEMLRNVLANDERYEVEKPKVCENWKVRNASGGKVKNFAANITVFILPDCNPIFDFISSAKRRLYIVAPYMNFDWYTSKKPLLEAIRLAKQNGADVKVVLDKKHADDEVIEILTSEGVEVALVSRIHGKAIVADDRVLITSANMNMYGLKLNREIGIIIENDSIADFVIEDIESSKTFAPLDVLIPLAAFLISALLFAIGRNKL